MTRTRYNAFGHEIVAIQDCIRNQHAAPLLRDSLRSICSCIEGGEERAEMLVNDLWDAMAKDSPIEEVEREAHEVVDLRGERHARVAARLRERSALIFKQIEPWIVGGSVLDFGCGDGQVGWNIKKARSGMDVDLYDVMDYIDPTVGLRGHFGPQCESVGLKESYDTTLLLTVLHHCSEPLQVLDCALRRTRKRLIIIESVFGIEGSDCARKLEASALERAFASCEPMIQFMYAEFFDWFYNRVVHLDVNVPFNFETPIRWGDRLSRYGSVASAEMLGIDQPLVPEFHVLFVVDK